ncbi:hypothetical protein ACHAWF_018520 [Thalassiosira exigua]
MMFERPPGGGGGGESSPERRAGSCGEESRLLLPSGGSTSPPPSPPASPPPLESAAGATTSSSSALLPLRTPAPPSTHHHHHHHHDPSPYGTIFNDLTYSDDDDDALLEDECLAAATAGLGGALGLAAGSSQSADDSPDTAALLDEIRDAMFASSEAGDDFDLVGRGGAPRRPADGPRGSGGGGGGRGIMPPQQSHLVHPLARGDSARSDDGDGSCLAYSMTSDEAGGWAGDRGGGSARSLRLSRGRSDQSQGQLSHGDRSGSGSGNNDDDDDDNNPLSPSTYGSLDARSGRGSSAFEAYRPPASAAGVPAFRPPGVSPFDHPSSRSSSRPHLAHVHAHAHQPPSPPQGEEERKRYPRQEAQGRRGYQGHHYQGQDARRGPQSYQDQRQRPQPRRGRKNSPPKDPNYLPKPRTRASSGGGGGVNRRRSSSGGSHGSHDERAGGAGRGARGGGGGRGGVVGKLRDLFRSATGLFRATDCPSPPSTPAGTLRPAASESPCTSATATDATRSPVDGAEGRGREAVVGAGAGGSREDAAIGAGGFGAEAGGAGADALGSGEAGARGAIAGVVALPPPPAAAGAPPRDEDPEKGAERERIARLLGAEAARRLKRHRGRLRRIRRAAEAREEAVRKVRVAGDESRGVEACRRWWNGREEKSSFVARRSTGSGPRPRLACARQGFRTGGSVRSYEARVVRKAKSHSSLGPMTSTRED